MRLWEAQYQFEIEDLFAAPWALDRGQLRNVDTWAIASFPHNPAFAGGSDRANAALVRAAPELLAELIILVKRCDRLPNQCPGQTGTVKVITKEAGALIARIQAELDAAATNDLIEKSESGDDAP